MEVNAVSVWAMLYTLVTLVGSYYIARYLGKKASNSDKIVIAWLIWDVIIHSTLELPFVLMSLFGSKVEDYSNILAEIWKEYAKADGRWSVADSGIVSLEILTVFVVTPMCLILIYAICHQKPFRSFLQVSVCVCELYGGWMTFGPEWLTGNKNLATDNALYLYIYLIFYNGIWVVVPAWLLYLSWLDIVDSAGRKRRKS